MKNILVAAAIALVLQAVTGCRNSGDAARAAEKESAVLESRMARLSASLADTDSSDARGKPIARWFLPPELAEVSGIALTPDGRLFAHNDETTRITEIDYRRGTVIKHFFVGEESLHGDFEGLTYAGDRFFLLSSDGTLYEFQEGAQGERVSYDVHDTKLGKECEFEGVTYDSTTNTLVLACKNVGMKQLHGMLVLYRYRLDGTGREAAEIAVPYAEAIGENDWQQIRPTDVTVDPTSGNFVMVAAQEKALMEITPAGAVVFSRSLGGRHPQSEALAITRDHILIIGDEATTAPATITLYRWP